MTSIVDQLLKRPAAKPKKAVASYTATDLNGVHQADLLFLPRDPQTGARYVLSVIDLATRAVAARPLQTKGGEEVLRALKHIYAHDPRLKVPMRFEVDAGTEFNAANKWLRSQTPPVTVRVGRPGRHTQQRAVENLNKALSVAISRRQTAEELLTDKPALHWVSDLQDYVQAVNDKWVRTPADLRDRAARQMGADVAADGQRMYEVGERVRVALDRPTDVLGRVLPTGSGKSGFRAGDIRWDPTIRTITDIYFKGGQSLRYGVSGIRNASYGPWQLQLVRANEKYPAGKDVIRGKPAGYIPLALHGKRKNAAGRIEFLVEWRGFPAEAEWTWEPRAELMKSTEGARLVRAMK